MWQCEPQCRICIYLILFTERLKKPLDCFYSFCGTFSLFTNLQQCSQYNLKLSLWWFVIVRKVTETASYAQIRDRRIKTCFGLYFEPIIALHNVKRSSIKPGSFFRFPFEIKLLLSTPTHLGLLSGNSVNGKTSLDVIDQTEELTGLFNGDDICH